MAKLKCLRCQHEWDGILDRPPKVCPKCKSYDYNKPYKRPPKR